MAAGTYYARRVARDPEWREAQIADAKERRRSRREADPEGDRERRNASARRWYAQLRERDPERFAALRQTKTERDRRRRATLTEDERTALRAADAERKRRERARTQGLLVRGLTFAELLQRVGGDRDVLDYVLRDELRRGTLDYSSTMRRWSINGGLDAAVRDALRLL